MRAAVVDASVAAKWVVQEPHSAQAALLLEYDARHAPDHWRAEAVNLLWSKVCKGDLTAADVQDRMTTLMRAPVIPTASATLMPRAFALSVARNITIYESLYVSLGEKLDLPVVTADLRLIRRLADDPALARRMVWVGDLAP